MIEDVRSGERLETAVFPVHLDDLRTIGPGWRFDWVALLATSEVYRLVTPSQPDATLGLIALRRFPGQHVEVDLLEANSEDVGSGKRRDGIAGDLLAFAASLSFQIGGEGYVAIYAKTELLVHYESWYGFRRVGKSTRMYLETAAAAALIRRHEGRSSDA